MLSSTEVWRFETSQFIVSFSVQEEHDLDLSWDEDGSTRQGLEDSSLIAFVACLECHWSDGAQTVLLATDYLGGCIYESPRAFMDHRGSRGGSYFSGMVRSVCEEARKVLASMPQVRRVA